MPELFGAVCDGISFDNAINNVLISIAMEESAIAHILNAEGEILQYMTGSVFHDADENGECGHAEAFTSVADSMIGVVDSLADIECRLTKKLMVASQCNHFGDGGATVPIVIPEICANLCRETRLRN